MYGLKAARFYAGAAAMQARLPCTRGCHAGAAAMHARLPCRRGCNAGAAAGRHRLEHHTAVPRMQARLPCRRGCCAPQARARNRANATVAARSDRRRRQPAVPPQLDPHRDLRAPPQRGVGEKAPVCHTCMHAYWSNVWHTGHMRVLV
jgi:hypothetical protein